MLGSHLLSQKYHQHLHFNLEIFVLLDFNVMAFFSRLRRDTLRFLAGFYTLQSWLPSKKALMMALESSLMMDQRDVSVLLHVNMFNSISFSFSSYTLAHKLPFVYFSNLSWNFIFWQANQFITFMFIFLGDDRWTGLLAKTWEMIIVFGSNTPGHISFYASINKVFKLPVEETG